MRQRRHMRDDDWQRWRWLSMRVSGRLHGRQLYRRAADDTRKPVKARVRAGTARNGAGIRQRRAHGRAVRIRARGCSGCHRGGALHEKPSAPGPEKG